MYKVINWYSTLTYFSILLHYPNFLSLSLSPSLPLSQSFIILNIIKYSYIQECFPKIPKLLSYKFYKQVQKCFTKIPKLLSYKFYKQFFSWFTKFNCINQGFFLLKDVWRNSWFQVLLSKCVLHFPCKIQYK